MVMNLQRVKTLVAEKPYRPNVMRLPNVNNGLRVGYKKE